MVDHAHDLEQPHREAPPRGQVPPATFAALDLGTNNCRLLVGAPAGDGFRVLDSFSRIVRLGEGLQRPGGSAPWRWSARWRRCTPAPPAWRAGRCGAARHRHRGVPPGRQRREFLDRVRAETGLRFDVISTREEAELALESCAPLLRRRTAAGALLFDIGGGSTELAWVRLRRPRGRS